MLVKNGVHSSHFPRHTHLAHVLRDDREATVEANLLPGLRQARIVGGAAPWDSKRLPRRLDALEELRGFLSARSSGEQEASVAERD